jgi:predicted lipoprotein with Yx(FWY)xxD motif
VSRAGRDGRVNGRVGGDLGHLHGEEAEVVRRRILIPAVLVVTLSTSLAIGGIVGASPKPKAKGTVVTTNTGAFGTMLVVGSGRFAGFSLYFISSDQPPTYGCTTGKVKHLKFTCTGPENAPGAEWPALTTNGAPIAGAGVDQSMLGTVTRKKVGTQVTYDGHPLYLFDRGPGQITGEGWDEPTLPPWQGIWWLMAPSGNPLPWAGTLTTTTADSQSVVAAQMQTGVGTENFPVYSSSSDTSTASNCTGACAVAWPPVLTSGTPGVSGGSSASDLGTVARADGTTQVTYKGMPLYFYSQEGITKSGINYLATGSGNGLSAPSPATGTFSLVTP